MCSRHILAVGQAAVLKLVVRVPSLCIWPGLPSSTCGAVQLEANFIRFISSDTFGRRKWLIRLDQNSDAARIKRGTLSVKTKRKQPFVLKSFLSHADGGRTKAKYRKNEIIFRQGDSADAVFYIIDGKCKVTVVSEKGKEAVVALHEKGDFFGEGCLTGQPRRLATVTAITVSEIMRLDKATMVRVLHDEPKFSELFISHLLARNVRVEADLVDQLFNSSEKRLARLLLLMANFGKEGRPEPVIAKVSQETLAEMIGTTRSRVSFFMNKFRKLGFIDYNGGLEVHSSLLNMVLHETPGITKGSDGR